MFHGQSSLFCCHNWFGTKKYHSRCPTTMLHHFFSLSPCGNKKARPPIATISKSITTITSSSTCCSNRVSPSSIEPSSPPMMPAKFPGYQWRLIITLLSDTKISSTATNYHWQWQCPHSPWLCHEIYRGRCTLALLQQKKSYIKESFHPIWLLETVQPLFSKMPANIAYNDVIPENLVVMKKATYMINFSHPIYSALKNA